MTNDQIKYMADRFLGWKLPEDFHPDNGISFEPEFNAEYMAKRGLPPMRRDPIGTNLFNATQAEAMVRHMVEGIEASQSHSLPGDVGMLVNQSWLDRRQAEPDADVEAGAPIRQHVMPGDPSDLAQIALQWYLKFDFGYPHSVRESNIAVQGFKDGYRAALTPSALSGDAGEGELRKALAKRTSMSTIAGGGQRPHVEIRFASLADAHALTDAILNRSNKEDDHDSRP